MSDTSIIVSIPENRSDDGSKFSFSIEQDADCFCFYAIGEFRSGYATRLTSSTGFLIPDISSADLYSNELIPDGKYKGFAKSHETGITAFSTPISASSAERMKGISGPWTGVRVKFIDDGVRPSLKIVQRIRDPARQVNGYGLRINLAVYANSGSANINKFIKRARREIAGIFAEAKIKCSFGAIKNYPLPEGGISVSFNDANTKAAVSENASTDAVSVIFVQNLKAGDDIEGKKTAGITGGIPGPQGFITNRSAVLINLDTTPSNPDNADIQNFAITIAHELGHYLGLKHWPEERPKKATKREKQNLMYYTSNSEVRELLEPEQTLILQNMPIVEILYVNRELIGTDKTPVETLEIEITTGDRTFLGTPTDNQNMGLTFALGSDEAGYQSWVLATADNGGVFEPGKTTSFPITSIDNLFMEDLVAWSVDAEWSDGSSQPMRFATSTDYWDFLRIKITANGKVVTDTEVGKILTWVGQHSLVQKIRS
jgi:hypothetical protein